MPLLLPLLLLSLSFLSPAIAWAQLNNNQDDKVIFITLDPKMIQGQRNQPQVFRHDAKRRAKFERIFRLKKDFLSDLRSTAKEAALR